MKNDLIFDDLIVKVAISLREMKELPQIQIDALIKDELALTTSEYWDASGLKDELDFLFDD